MTYNPSYIADLLVKSFIGTLTAEEQQLLDHWLAADERHPRIFQLMLDRQRLKTTYERYRAIDNRGSWEALRARLADAGLPEYEAEAPEGAVAPPARRAPFFRTWAAVMWTLLGIGVLTAALLIWNGGRNPNPVASAIRQDEGGKLSVTTPAGGSYRLLLPDSSVVNLNANSRLDMDSTYRQQRQVSLQGEAFFVIHHRGSQPFTVNIGPSINITATGTSFEVMAYPEDSIIRVTLISGSLRICDTAGKPHLLEPHQTLIMGRFGQVRTPPSLDMMAEIPWVHDQFDYKGAPIGEILSDLRHWYGVEMTVVGESTDHYTFSCSRQEPLRFILERLKKTGHLDYDIVNEKKVTIYFNQH